MAQGDTHDGLSMYGWWRLRIMLDATRATDVHIGHHEERYHERSKDQVNKGHWDWPYPNSNDWEVRSCESEPFIFFHMFTS